MSPTPLTRPRTIADMKATLSQLQTEETMRRALAFRPRASDVFIATYPKCGTTWMQQIVHGLRSGGDMAFSEITQVVPWLESAYDMGLDPEDDRWQPRAFKTHCPYDAVPKGGKYIYVMRDPRDVLVSFYHFFAGWMFEPGTITLDQFAREFFCEGTKSGRYWVHVRSWWPLLGAPEALHVCFEDMKADLPGVVARVAAFIGCDDPAAIDVATRQASFAFMRAHDHQFDDHLLRQARDAACGLPRGITSKLRTGRVGDHAAEVPADIADLLASIWREEIADTIGLASYGDLRARVNAVY